MKSKILCTGMNKAQCTKDFFLNQVLKVVPSHYSLIRCLEDIGYEVEQRPAILGEDLSGYDHVIVYLHSPQSFCQNLYTGLYAISQREDVILAFDDWQVNQIYAGIEGILGDLENEAPKAFREYLISLQDQKYSVEEYPKYTQEYITACKRVLSRSQRLLISAFAGGDLSLLKLQWQPDKIYRFNPNPYHYNRRPDNHFLSGVRSIFSSEYEPEDKSMEWNFASLVQKKTKKWLNSQNLMWYVNLYGQMKGPEKNTRLTEDQMCEVYAAQWGCLMPAYFHAGSGWWRAKPLQVADAGSILFCDQVEASVFGDAYIIDKASYIESKDLKGLIALATAQRECLYDNHPLDKTVEQDEILRVLQS